MGKLLGYIVALIGLVVIALSFFSSKINLPFKLPNPSMLIIGGIVIIVVGIILALGKSERQLEEVPIYEGKGKQRKVVGYQRMKK